MDTTSELEFNNIIREYNRLVRQFARINNVQLGVLKLLKDLSLIDWFRYTSNFNNGDLKKTSMIINVLFESKNVYNRDSDSESFLLDSYLDQLESLFDSVGLHSMLIEEYNNIPENYSKKNRLEEVVDSGNNIIEKFKNGIENYHFRFIIWTSYKRLINFTYKILKQSTILKPIPLKELDFNEQEEINEQEELGNLNIYNKLLKDREIKKQNRILEKLFKFMDYMAQIHPADEIVNMVVFYKNIYNEYLYALKSGDIIAVHETLKTYFKQYNKQASENIAYLFVLLNTKLVPHITQTNIVDFLKETSLKHEIQKRYNIFRNKFPTATDWKFSDRVYNIDIREIDSKESKDESNTVSVNNWKQATLGQSNSILILLKKCKDKDDKYRSVLELLYNHLTKNQSGDSIPKYINCSKVDFIYILGGKIHETEQLSDNPVINWVDKRYDTMKGFFYALYYDSKKGTLSNDIGKGDKKNCYSHNGEIIKISENKAQSIRNMKEWSKLIQKMANAAIASRQK